MDQDAGADRPPGPRELTVRLTLHSGSDTTARDDARERVEEALEGGGVTEWRIEGSEIVEPPAAPFEPHTVAVRIAADGPVEDALADAGLERVSG